MPYTVSTAVFEGPFDLLLHLVNRQAVDLWEVSISGIVDEYVATLEGMRAALDLDTATEFLLIAAVLLELKARRLLPVPDQADPEEELALWEERDLLLARLLDCKTFKDAAASLEAMMDAAALCWPRACGLDERYSGLAPDPLAGVSADDLREAMEALRTPRPAARLLLDHVAPVRASVADAVEELLVELPRLGRADFRLLVAGAAERLEVIVRFLAVLELYKQGAVDLHQAESFGRLEVTWLGGPGGLPAVAQVAGPDHGGARWGADRYEG